MIKSFPMDEPAFLEDIYPQNLLYAKTIRSPVSKGYVNLIDYPRLPENYFLVTAKNIPGENRLEDTEMPILTDGKLSYTGEPVALLLGPDKTKLVELAAKCTVVAVEEKPFFTCDDANNEPLFIAAQRYIQTGDTQKYFDRSGIIIRGCYSTGIQEHWYAEPSGAVTWYENKLIVKTSTQWPYHVKRAVARVLGINHSDLSVETTSLGHHMDGKLWYPSLIACHAALGTYVTKRPVRLVLTKKEDFLYSPKRFKTDIDIASAVDENGNITATDINIFVNAGAFKVNENEIIDQICLGTAGFYDCGNIKITAKAHLTNIPPQGPFCGFGLAHGIYAMERHISQITDTLKKDPIEWRKNHFNLKLPSSSGGIVELIDAAAKMSDYYRKRASFELLRQSRKEKPLLSEKTENPRGIGIAAGFQGNGLLYHGEDNGKYSVEAAFTKEKILEIRSSINSPESYNIIWSRIASGILNINPGKVRLVSNPAPDSGPSCSSRNITVLTDLMEKCCREIKNKIPHEKLPITVSHSADPDAGSFSKPSTAAAVVEVSIDPVECLPKIRGVWLGINCGKIHSLNRIKRNIARNSIIALGWAFTEHIEYINGILPDSQYDNYSIPREENIPPISINFLHNNEDEEPKGVGDLPFTCVPAAFLQAVSQAMDHCYKSIPLKRKDIWDVFKKGADK